MFQNNIKFAWRNIVKHKGNASLNILSLSVGIACFIFIFTFVNGELSYDKFHDRPDDLHRVVIDLVDAQGNRLPDATTPPALAPALKATFPEVAQSVRVFPTWGPKYLFGTDEANKHYEDGFLRTDSTFFDVFTFEAIHGNLKTALDEPLGIVLTESTAMKYFGKTDVVGEALLLYGRQKANYKINAIIKDVPFNSHFKFDILGRLNFQNLNTNWGWYNYYTYIRLNENAQISSLEPKLQPFFESQIGEREQYNIIYSQPITSIHLNSKLKWELEPNSSMTSIYIFSILGLFVLLISCLNYVNLNIGGALKRFKEVGVRKVFGAYKSTLVGQFITETVLLLVISIGFGALLAEFLFQNLSEVLGRDVSLFSGEETLVLLVIGTIIMVIGITCGIYPALHLSSYKVANAVKGISNNSGKSILGLRQILLVVQFAISAFLIFGTIGVYQQLNHFKNLDKGLTTDQVVVIENARAVKNQALLKNELEKIPSVKSVGISDGVIGKLNWTRNIGYPDPFLVNYLTINHELIEALDMELLEGRMFDRSKPTDKSGFTMLVNETAFEALGISYDDIGKPITIGARNDTSLIKGRVIGVLKNFQFADYSSEIKPFAFVYRENSMDYVSIKLNSQNMNESLRGIEEAWRTASNDAPLSYKFLDQTYAELYAKENTLSKILSYLTALAIVIAVIGMFAIANMNISYKRKEIAVRKVLGGSTQEVSFIFIKKFVTLVIIANVIALPLAFFALNNWLNSFTSRSEGSYLTIGITLIITIAIAWITVGSQSVKAAISNPVKSLRSE